MLDLFETIDLGLVMLLSLANPLVTAALLLDLVGNTSGAERNRQPLMASVYVFAITMVAYHARQPVADTLSTLVPDLRITGDLTVAFISSRMPFPQQKAINLSEVKSKSRELEDKSNADITFVPLATPNIAGPGTVATTISPISTVC